MAMVSIRFLSAPVAPHWKVVANLNLRHSPPLEVLFPMASLFFLGSKFSDSVHGSDQISFRAHSSSLESASEPKFASFCSSRGNVSDGITFFCRSQTFQILTETHGPSLESANELNFSSFCSSRGNASDGITFFSRVKVFRFCPWFRSNFFPRP